MRDAGSDRDRFAQAVFASSLGYFDILSMHLGLRLGLYRALADGGAMTSVELASNGHRRALRAGMAGATGDEGDRASRPPRGTRPVLPAARARRGAARR